MTLTRLSFTALAAGAALLALAAAASAADMIRILCPTWPGFAPVHAARDLGYFKEEGLEVDIKFEDDRANVMAAFERGDIEADMRTVGEHQGRPRDETTPGVIIGTIDQSLGGDGVIADASIEGAADLKGKTVAAELNIPARLILQLKLKEAGLTLKDLQIKDIATADTVAVFTDGSIMAVATYEPYMSQAVKNSGRAEAKVLFSSKDTPGLITDIIAVRREDLAANPEKYRKFLRGVYRAIDYANKEPEKFAELVAPNFNLTGADIKDILASGVKYTTYEDAVAYMGKAGETGELHTIFDTVMELNLENGAADTKLVATQQIDNSVVRDLFAGKDPLTGFRGLLAFRGARNRGGEFAVGVAVALLLIAFWEAASRGGVANPRFLPPPSAVIAAAADMLANQHLAWHAWISTLRVWAAFLVAAAMAIPLGLWMSSYRIVGAALEPVIDFIRYLPVPALVPLSIIWFGIGETTKIFLLWLGTFFQLVLLVADSARRVPGEYIETALTLGAKPRAIIGDVTLRAMLPELVDNLRITLGWCWTYLIIAEIVAADSGIGFVIWTARRFVKTPEVMAGVVAIGVIGLATDQLLRLLHRRWFRYL